jgi:hypothetical protein
MVASSPAGRVAACAVDVDGTECDVVEDAKGVEVGVEGSPPALNDVEVDLLPEVEVDDFSKVAESLEEHPPTINAKITAEQSNELTRRPLVPHPCPTDASLPRKATIWLLLGYVPNDAPPKTTRTSAP